MNVLILTTGRVASTPLQRVLTTFMLHNGFDKPIINFHDLLHGIEKYHNPYYGIETIRKNGGIDERDFSQSLSEIVDLLDSTNHYKVTRIAYYGIIRRDDPIEEQLRLYEYLNKNFHIIRCGRENLLEFALSWIIAKHSNQLNITSITKKDKTFNNFDGITVSKHQLIKRLNDYNKFIEWSDTYFNIHTDFVYENSINHLEEFITGLDFMPDSYRSWNDIFGIDFSDWMDHHNVGSTEPNYQITYNQIQSLVDKQIMPTHIPVKLQSLSEKQSLIKNFDECVEWYNQWKQSK